MRVAAPPGPERDARGFSLCQMLQLSNNSIEAATFPMPTLLDRDTEAALIRAAQSGDETATETLMADNAGLIAGLARHYLPVAGALDYEDLVQEGRLGLLVAIRK